MTKNTKSKSSGHVPSKPTLNFEVTEFEVTEEGTLRLAGYEDPETRAEFYEDIVDWWENSPSDLAYATDECSPLFWEVKSIYSSIREELQAVIEAAEEEQKPDSKKLDMMNARLQSMPEEPEEGAGDWLLGMDDDYFKANMVERIRKWFSEPPEWIWEGDYLSNARTAQSIAMGYFQEMDEESLDLLGVEVIEGQCPGNSYYAANLRSSIGAANAAAEAAGLPVRFVAVKD